MPQLLATRQLRKILRSLRRMKSNSSVCLSQSLQIVTLPTLFMTSTRWARHPELRKSASSLIYAFCSFNFSTWIFILLRVYLLSLLFTLKNWTLVSSVLQDKLLTFDRPFVWSRSSVELAFSLCNLCLSLSPLYDCSSFAGKLLLFLLWPHFLD